MMCNHKGKSHKLLFKPCGHKTFVWCQNYEHTEHFNSFGISEHER